MTPPLRALLLDLDDTLIDEAAASRVALLALVAALGNTYGGTAGADPEVLDANTPSATLFARWRAVSARHWRRYEQGELDFQGQRRCRVRDFIGLPLSDGEADGAYGHYYAAYRDAWALVPGVAAFLAASSHLPKLILTNGDRTQQREKVRRTGLETHVQATLTPADCGHWKPHPGMFLAALAQLSPRGIRPEECLMVGDDPLRDIAPAAALGLQTLQVQPGAQGAALLALLPRLLKS